MARSYYPGKIESITSTLLPTIPAVAEAREVAAQIRAAGFEVAVVGGAVRDVVSGIAPHDIDLATNAPAQWMMENIAGARASGVAMLHGTVTIDRPHGAIEITRYRRDLQTDGRHAVVEDADRLEDDLARRDFTINAMAIRLHDGSDEMLDPWGGRMDLLAGRLRTVGDPAVRFKEDALRILRAYRFAGRLGLAIDSDARKAMRDGAAGILAVSVPRRWMEWRKFWEETDQEIRAKLLRDMAEDGVLADAWGATMNGAEAAGRLPSGARAETGLALLIGRNLELEHEEMARWVTEEVARVQSLLCDATTVPWRSGARTAVRAMMTKFPEWSVADVAMVLHAASPLSETDPWYPGGEVVQSLSESVASMPRSPGGMAIGGSDLLAASGRSPGPWIGDMLRSLHAGVVEERVSSDREALLAAARAMLAESAIPDQDAARVGTGPGGDAPTEKRLFR